MLDVLTWVFDLVSLHESMVTRAVSLTPNIIVKIISNLTIIGKW